MHAYDIMIVVSAACVTGFLAMIYSRESLPLYAAYIAASVIGTFAGAWVFFWYVPIHDQAAVVIGALGGGAACVLIAARLMRGR